MYNECYVSVVTGTHRILLISFPATSRVLQESEWIYRKGLGHGFFQRIVALRDGSPHRRLSQHKTSQDMCSSV